MVHSLHQAEHHLDSLVWIFILTIALGFTMAIVLWWAVNSVQKERTRAAVEWGRRLLNAQEEERRDIARELHDGVVPLIESMGMELRRAGADDGSERASSLAQQLRTLSRGLHPSTLDHLPMADAIQQLTRSMATDDFEITFTSENVPALEFPHRLAGYRIVQEALSNARRHAGASRVDVTLLGSPTATDLTIRDNGAGFVVPTDTKLASLGIRSMRERASALGGTVTITSAPGNGTTIQAHLPVTVAP